jgi:hypothetical protein
MRCSFQHAKTKKTPLRANSMFDQIHNMSFGFFWESNPQQMLTKCEVNVAVWWMVYGFWMMDEGRRVNHHARAEHRE